MTSLWTRTRQHINASRQAGKAGKAGYCIKAETAQPIRALEHVLSSRAEGWRGVGDVGAVH